MSIPFQRIMWTWDCSYDKGFIPLTFFSLRGGGVLPWGEFFFEEFVPSERKGISRDSLLFGEELL